MKLRRMLAVWAAKCAEKISVKVFHRQGVTWAGKIALKICPDILSELAAQVREDIFIVCGTNGKTTTNNMLCAALEAEGKKVVCNHTGSNMLNGVAAAFALSAGWGGNLDADCASIEIDEASTKRVFPYFKPDYMVLTNLFRDQLDRYGEIDITMNLLKEMMQTAHCRRFLPWMRGIPILRMESVRRLWMIRIPMRLGKDVSVRNAGLSCIIIFTITASLGIMHAQPVILNVRKSGMTHLKSRWKTDYRLRWRIGESVLIIRDFIMCIIFWRLMRLSGARG